MLRGIEGFGATSQIHTARLLSLSQDLPIAVIIVDAPERIQTFLLELDLIVTEGAAARRDRHAGRWHRRRVHHLVDLGLGVPSRWARTAAGVRDTRYDRALSAPRSRRQARDEGP